MRRDVGIPFLDNQVEMNVVWAMFSTTAGLHIYSAHVLQQYLTMITIPYVAKGELVGIAVGNFRERCTRWSGHLLVVVN